jgi:hypothetical protein
MTDDTEKPISTADSLKRALAMKKKGAAGAGLPGADGHRPAEKIVAARAAAMNKPAFKKASKRG